MPGRNVHVAPIANGWVVEAEGWVGGQQKFTTEEEAIAAGTERAKRDKVELIIHNRDGRIRQRDSFGLDSRNINK
ncbi:DUF2188 domain-containing protein [Cupriavidus taiwanensis]|uniref:DUF2188 domain-containing protein n=1 Tax=Cupriavidus taiwanensis TaxID=164546 RepID=UPI0015744565|nr:DUF2188 domain-containing protein [Cupriavidus taiwanensis]NSX15639.1 DUF2188 domain-containing protein [Cupriavidus taiwanensis]